MVPTTPCTKLVRKVVCPPLGSIGAKIVPPKLLSWFFSLDGDVGVGTTAVTGVPTVLETFT